MTKATAGGGPPSIYRVDMPCEQAGFSRPPFDIHLKVLPGLAAGGDWTLLAHSSTGMADVMAKNPFPPEFGTDAKGNPKRSAEKMYLWMMEPGKISGRSSHTTHGKSKA